MPRPQPAALALSSTVLRVLTKLNLLLGALILALLIVSLIADSWFQRAFDVPVARSNFLLLAGMRMIMVIGICATPIVHFILTRLRMIVETGRALAIRSWLPMPRGCEPSPGRCWRSS